MIRPTPATGWRRAPWITGCRVPATGRGESGGDAISSSRTMSRMAAFTCPGLLVSPRQNTVGLGGWESQGVSGRLGK